MNSIEQQARELAERCVNTVYANPNNPNRQRWIDRILRELNLVSLLEDKARLDWLGGKDCETWMKVQWNTDSNTSVRTAITNAMKEDGK